MIIVAEEWIVLKIINEHRGNYSEVCLTNANPTKEWTFCVSSPTLTVYFNLPINAYNEYLNFVKAIDT